MPIFVRSEKPFLEFFRTKQIFPAERSTFAYSMPPIFGKLMHQRLILAIWKKFQCIPRGVRILLANCTQLCATSETLTKIHILTTFATINLYPPWSDCESVQRVRIFAHAIH